jgi:hypothetical protein
VSRADIWLTGRQGKLNVEAPTTEAALQYQNEWKALSNRIRGLTEALHLHAAILAVNSNDSFSVARKLLEHIWKIGHALRAFKDTFGDTLPQQAQEAIGTILSEIPQFTAGMPVSETSDARRERVWASVVMLSAFEAEMTFALSGNQEAVLARSERAFSHLQRSIIVDPKVSAEWKAAFKKGEVACEKLGAVHLLLHGIYAFKAHAGGGRTDLVFQEPVEFEGELRFAEGLVLTEWKIVTKDNVASQCEHARSQAAKYAQGVLGGAELTSYRYIVGVSRDYVHFPQDVNERGVIYRHKNIAVAPNVPSRSTGSTARRRPAAGR